jgi:hypothetical protein
LLNQQDRFGNIHRDVRYYYQVTVGELSNVKSESDIENVPPEYRDKVLTINEMILKDNDCGVSKSNNAMKARLLEGVRHINPETYRRFMKFAEDIKTPEFEDLFRRGLLFKADDYASVRHNAHEMAELLLRKCEKGDLKLDLDQDLYFSSQELPTTFVCN